MSQKIFHLTTFLILFFILLLNIQPTKSYNITKYEENEVGLQIFNTLSYKDGTLVIYMVKPINETCVEPTFRIRVVYPNGTIETNKKTYPIPEFSFCKSIAISVEDRFTMKIFRLQPKYAILAYLNSTDVNASADYGIVLSKNGEFLR